MPRTRRAVASVGVLLLLSGGLAAAGFAGGTAPSAASNRGPTAAPSTAGPSGLSPSVTTAQRRPNIVMVLTDDLSSNLVKYMPHVRAMKRAGMTFANYTVTNSLCCPSRSSILTGDYPHNTGVFANQGPDGGFGAFELNGDEQHTFALALQNSGYRTAMMGKYLNGYSPTAVSGYANAKQVGWPGAPATGGNYVAPGWTTWAVQGNGYSEFNYDLNLNHRILYFGNAPADYGVHTLDRLGQGFIANSADTDQPFMLELATFAPHAPYTPAYRDRDLFPKLKAPRTPAWDKQPRHAPRWLARRPPLTRWQIARIDHQFRARVRAVQSVDRAIAHLREALRLAGQLSNTVFVFTSDNGLHLGEYGLTAGKLSAFDTDVRVPLVVTGPGIAAGRVSHAVVQNVDLAPTFEQLAGLPADPAADGASIVGLLHGHGAARWPTLALVEHHGVDFTAYQNDPDRQPRTGGRVPTYNALRSAQFTYVHYQNGQREYYDRRVDPYELNNIVHSLSPARIHTLDRWLAALTSCSGSAQCTAAGRPRRR
jgi:N-acetylglucosamine-6-sulfatase